MVDYPAILPLPSWSYARNQPTGAMQGSVTTKPMQQRVSYDNEVAYSLSFEFTKGQARLFRQWYVEVCDMGRKPFNITLLTKAGLVSRLVRFTADGRPQPSIRQNVMWFYSATVVSRS